MSHTPTIIDTHMIRRCELFYQLVKRRLRLAGVEFTPIDSNWGYWIAGACNPRTGSEWHSPHEAREYLRRKRIA